MNVTLSDEAWNAVSRLAIDLRITREEAVLRAVNGALLMRWLVLDVGSPVPGREESM